MRRILSLMLMTALLFSCNSDKKKNKRKSSYAHEVVAKEIIQVGGYTYIRSEEEGKEKWLAAPSFNGKIGETYYFNEGLEMVDFKSKGLNRTFASILFLQNIYSDPNEPQNKQNTVSNKISKPVQKQENIKIEKIKGVTTISELYANLKKYKGKKVLVKGKVTKFNAMIMNKNWIHLEDGTKHDSNFDLIITSKENFAVGDIVTLEGVVAVDIDLGYGYKYELLLEKAVKVND